jgi:6-pyruvoyltetrahydropterin/6-carboxytetrahydropterin synthase
MYEVGVVDQFEAAHRLRGNFGPATHTHGHTYRVELAVRGRTLRDDGTLCDIGLLGEALRRAVAELNYQDLDELPRFHGRNTTAEVLAEYVVAQVQDGFRAEGLQTIAVTVWESPRAFATCERRLGPDDYSPATM